MSSSWLTYSILLSQCLAHSRLTINVYYHSEECQIISEVEIKVNDIPTVSSWKVKCKAKKNWGFIWINLNSWEKRRTQFSWYMLKINGFWTRNYSVYKLEIPGKRITSLWSELIHWQVRYNLWRNSRIIPALLEDHNVLDMWSWILAF